MAHGSNGRAGHAPRGAGLGEPLPRPCRTRRADAPAPWMPRPGRPPMSGGPWAPSCCNPQQLQLGGTVAAMGYAAGTRAGRGAGPAWAHCPGVRSSTSAGQNHSSLMTRTPLTPPPRDGLGPVSCVPRCWWHVCPRPPQHPCSAVLPRAGPTPSHTTLPTGDPPEAVDNGGMAQNPVTPWGPRGQLHITKHKGQGRFLSSSKKPRPQRSTPSASQEHASQRHGARPFRAWALVPLWVSERVTQGVGGGWS